MSRAETIELAFSLILSMRRFHTRGFCHGDINPGSILAFRDKQTNHHEFRLVDTFFLDLEANSFSRKFCQPDRRTFLSPEAMIGFFLGVEGKDSFDR